MERAVAYCAQYLTVHGTLPPLASTPIPLMSGCLEHSIKLSKSKGRPIWVSGSKFIDLSAGSEEWQRARDSQDPSRAVGEFYTKITQKCIAKYGWSWDYKGDKDCPDPSPDDWANVMDHTGFEQAEIERHNIYFQWLRTVSTTAVGASRAYLTCIHLENQSVVFNLLRQSF